MAKGLVYIYSGDGRGKSPAAIGRAVQAAIEGKHVVIIQFLKGKGLGDSDFLSRMEPEIKFLKTERGRRLSILKMESASQRRFSPRESATC